MADKKPFYDYFQHELAFLRHSGQRFAERHPKIAKRLDFKGTESQDPHVERLLQSFAFLTGRLQQEIDRNYPLLSTAILETLYPQFTAPAPSCATVHFNYTELSGKITEKFVIPKGTTLYDQKIEGHPIFFQTAYETTIYPLQIKECSLVSSEHYPILEGVFQSHLGIKVTLASLIGGFANLELNPLRLYINGDFILQKQLLEGIFLRDPAACVFINDDMLTAEPVDVRPVGYTENQMLFPFPSHGHPGYQLLQEYFIYADKFMYLDLVPLMPLPNAKEITFLIPLSDQVPIAQNRFTHHSLLLGCTPVINLFKKTTEPLRFDQRRIEYRVIPDIRREDSTEIYRIEKVLGLKTSQQTPTTYAPYFSYQHHLQEQKQQSFWHARAVFDETTTDLKREVYLSFVDFDFNPLSPADETIYTEVLCTNRSLPNQLNKGDSLKSDLSLPVKDIRLVTRPTPQLYTNKTAESLWRLVSHLSIDYLTLTRDEQLMTLKELIQIYGHLSDERPIPELNLITEIQTKPVVRRMFYEAWRGFAPGTKIDLTLQSSPLEETSSFLFASVLNSVFSFFTTVNAFTELEIRYVNRPGVHKRWPPQSGTKTLL